MPSQIYLLSPKLHTQSRGLYSLHRIDSREEKRPKIIAARQQWVSTGPFEQADKDIKGKKIKAERKQRGINQQNFLDRNNQLKNKQAKQYLIFILHFPSLELTTSDINDILWSCTGAAPNRDCGLVPGCGPFGTGPQRKNKTVQNHIYLI